MFSKADWKDRISLSFPRRGIDSFRERCICLCTEQWNEHTRGHDAEELRSARENNLVFLEDCP